MKEAVVYVVDSSPSMNRPYPTAAKTEASSPPDQQQQEQDDNVWNTRKPSTRLEAAKQALQGKLLKYARKMTLDTVDSPDLLQA